MPDELPIVAKIMLKRSQEKREKEAKESANINFKKLKYNSIPFKNVEIDRMNAQKKNFE